MTTRARIIALTDAAGWSAYRLAKESGLCYQTVRRYLNGGHDVLTANADRMLAALKNSKQ